MGSSLNGSCKVCETQAKLTTCSVCQTNVCQKCFDYPIVLVPSENATLKNVEYTAGCKECFIKKTDLDFSKKYEIVGDANSQEIVLIHGAGSCRRMFLPHAEELAKKGYRCILMDLPGHGARMDEALNIQTCLEAIRQTIRDACKSKQPALIGGSLGGYVLMEVLGRDSTLCTKAVVMMSGQNVGVNRGKLASVGLWFLNKSITLMSQVGIAKNFLRSSTGSKDLIQQYVISLLKSGSFFRHGEQNVTLLKESDYEASLLKIEKKINFLFINGEKDFRDSEQIWLRAAGEGSKLKVYEKADHFFSHDRRFFDRLIQDIANFIKEA